MNKKTKTNFKKNLTNFFGAFGYFFCSLLVLWTVILYSNLISGVAGYLSDNKTSHVVRTVTPAVGNPDVGVLQSIVGLVVFVVIIALTMYFLIKIPSTMAKASKKVVREAAESVVPIVLKIEHKAETKKNHLKLTPTLILVLKLILVIIPLILSFLSQFMDKQFIDFYISIMVSLLLAAVSMLFFIFQYLFAKLLSVNKQEIW